MKEKRNGLVSAEIRPSGAEMRRPGGPRLQTWGTRFSRHAAYRHQSSLPSLRRWPTRTLGAEMRRSGGPRLQTWGTRFSRHAAYRHQSSLPSLRRWPTRTLGAERGRFHPDPARDLTPPPSTVAYAGACCGGGTMSEGVAAFVLDRPRLLPGGRGCRARLCTCSRCWQSVRGAVNTATLGSESSAVAVYTAGHYQCISIRMADE